MDTQGEVYELSGPDTDAKGVFTENGFLVKAVGAVSLKREGDLF